MAIKAAIGLILLAASLLAKPCSAQDAGIDARQLTQRRLFHLEVQGTHPSDPAVPRTGKAFAIGPRLLIAARHVIGKDSDWKPDTSARDEVARVIPQLMRRISLTTVNSFAGGVSFSPKSDQVFVVPPYGEGLDAIVLSATELDVGSPFRLSFCDIAKGKKYTAVLTEGNPTSVNALGAPVAVSVIARGYSPGEFGSLFAFDVEAGQTFSKSPDGNDGAPILDAEGHVIAMTSAIVSADVKTTILATPLSMQIPGASPLVARIAGVEGQEAVQCSLSKTVRTIYDRIASQFNWSVEAVRGTDGILEKVVITYDDPTTEEPTPRVKILPQFFGFTMDVFDSAQFIPDTRPPDDQYLVNTPVDGTTKRYEFAGLRQIGLNNFSRASTAGNQRCTRARCGITGVRIHIFPQLKERLSSEVVDENLYLRNPITRNIPWAVR